MMRAAVLALLASGCTLARHSGVVGRWRPERIVDSTACVERAGGGCARELAIGRDVPTRRFATGWVALPVGYLQRRVADRVESWGTVGGQIEYVRGRGGLALGARAGVLVATDFGERALVLSPVSLVAHAGVQRGELYAGGGYAPIAYEQTMNARAYVHDSVHAFAGARVWLDRRDAYGLSFNPELRVDTLGAATLISGVGTIGLHF